MKSQSNSFTMRGPPGPRPGVRNVVPLDQPGLLPMARRTYPQNASGPGNSRARESDPAFWRLREVEDLGEDRGWRRIFAKIVVGAVGTRGDDDGGELVGAYRAAERAEVVAALVVTRRGAFADRVGARPQVVEPVRPVP